jgi:hypothetical protein
MAVMTSNRDVVENQLAHATTPENDEIRVALRQAISMNCPDIFDLLSKYCEWTSESLRKTLLFALHCDRPHFVRRCLEIEKENAIEPTVSKAILEEENPPVNSALKELIKRQQNTEGKQFVRSALKCNVPEVIPSDAELPKDILFDLIEAGCLDSVRFLVESGQEVLNSHVTKALAAKHYNIAHFLSEKLSSQEHY